MKNNFVITIFTLLIMMGVTYLSLMTTDTGKKAKVDKTELHKAAKVSADGNESNKSVVMKCGTGKCGAGKCGSN